MLIEFQYQQSNSNLVLYFSLFQTIRCDFTGREKGLVFTNQSIQYAIALQLQQRFTRLCGFFIPPSPFPFIFFYYQLPVVLILPSKQEDIVLYIYYIVEVNSYYVFPVVIVIIKELAQLLLLQIQRINLILLLLYAP